MAKQCTRWLSVILMGLLGLAQPGLSAAGPIPSKDSEPAGASSHPTDLAKVRDFLARDEVAKALSSRGLPPSEVERRLAQLSDEDLRSLASNLNQIRAAGDVPQYIWILLAIFLAVSILVAIF